MIDYHALAPELILAGTLVVVLLVDFATRRKELAAAVALAGVFAALVPVLTLGFCAPLTGCDSVTRSLFDGSYVIDGYALVFKGFFLATVFVALLLAAGYLGRGRWYEGEYYFLLLAAALGATVMASARDFITLVVALELVSGPGFLLAGWRKADARSNEAAMKFFLIGVVALALLLFGVSLVYGVAGTQRFSDLAELPPEVTGLPVFALGVMFILFGLGFKVSAVPFHLWTPDTYQGAPTPVTAWLAVGSKAAGFVGLLSVTFLAFPQVRSLWGPVLWVVAALSMTVGNVVAIQQTDVVRLLGYSSIAHAGFMLVPFAAMAVATDEQLVAAFGATVIYLVIYLVMNLGAFAVVIAGMPRVGSAELEDWRGLWSYAPGLAALLGVFFFSLAGIPPLAGWFAKLAMFSAAIGVGNAWGWSIAAIAALNSVVALYYYAKVVKSAFFEPAPEDAGTEPLTAAAPVRLALALTAVAVVVLGVLPGAAAALGRYSSQLIAALR